MGGRLGGGACISGCVGGQVDDWWVGVGGERGPGQVGGWGGGWWTGGRLLFFSPDNVL